MRNRFFDGITPYSVGLAMMIALGSVVIASTGCGGGGGGGTNGAPGSTGGNTGNPGGIPINKSLATVTGRVLDQGSGAPVANVPVNVGSASTKTDALGNFSLPNVPLTSKGLTVNSPDVTVYQPNAQYGTADQVYPLPQCPIPLPALVTTFIGNSPLPMDIKIFPGGPSSPPAPPVINVDPATGCPKP